MCPCMELDAVNSSYTWREWSILSWICTCSESLSVLGSCCPFFGVCLNDESLGRLITVISGYSIWHRYAIRGWKKIIVHMCQTYETMHRQCLCTTPWPFLLSTPCKCNPNRQHCNVCNRNLKMDSLKRFSTRGPRNLWWSAAICLVDRAQRLIFSF